MSVVSTSFWESVFSLCRAPLTTSLVSIFDEWQRAEGGIAANNPLNTTRPMRGSTRYNDAGVQDYPNAATGAAATAMTLLNGRYPAIVEAMRANKPLSAWSAAPIPAEVDTWGTHDFSNYLRHLPPEEDDMDAQEHQMLQDVWEAFFSAAAPNGPAPWSNVEIIRRQLVTVGAPYNLHPGPVPAAPAPPPPPPATT